MKSSTKQLNMKPEILTEEQKHSAEISLKNSSQHSTAILCGRAFSKSPSINRNLQRITPPSQINSITSTADSTGRTPPKLQATLALCRLCPQTQIQSPTTSLHRPAMGGEKSLHEAIDIRKAGGPDNISPSTLESYAKATCPSVP